MSKESNGFSNIGFIQGRLSPIINERIQRFPSDNWKQEIEIASKYRFEKMEWTFDTDTLNDNPLLHSKGQQDILEMCKINNLTVPSITCDFFMENPPWKANKSHTLKIIRKVFKGMVAIGANLIIIPLVDNSSIKEWNHEKLLKSFFSDTFDIIESENILVCFESDFPPKKLKNFIEEFPENRFGINYDIGNSASLGFDPIEEFSSYGDRILNVHVKDRKLNGHTVSLGDGDANFELIFKLFKDIDYRGNYILQTARSRNNDHIGALIKYREMTRNWLSEC